MKHKGIAFLVTAVMLVTMVPMMAFATVDDLDLIDPDSPLYLRSNVATSVPVEFEVNAVSNNDVSARISLMKGDTEISYMTEILDLSGKNWEGTIDLPVNKGTTEGAYDIKIDLTQGHTSYMDTYDDMVIIDNTAPTSIITDPSNLAKLDIEDDVTIEGNASDPDISTSVDGSGIAGVAVLITGPSHYSVAPTVIGKETWSVDWETPTTPGAYIISARATDKVGNVQVNATVATVYVGIDAPAIRTLSMEATTGGTCSAITEGPYASGSAVSIIATASGGYEFTGWTATAGSFENSKDPTTIFTMPDQSVTVTANFKLITETDEDTEAYKAAPAIAAEILKANGISPNAKKEKGEKGDKGMNYISAIAKMMGNGASFKGVDKSNYDAYYDAVFEYLDGEIDKVLTDPRD